MNKSVLVLVLAVLVVIVGGGVYLGTMDLQPNRQTVEKVIPGERFAR